MNSTYPGGRTAFQVATYAEAYVSCRNCLAYPGLPCSGYRESWQSVCSTRFADACRRLEQASPYVPSYRSYTPPPPPAKCDGGPSCPNYAAKQARDESVRTVREGEKFFDGIDLTVYRLLKLAFSAESQPEAWAAFEKARVRYRSRQSREAS